MKDSFEPLDPAQILDATPPKPTDLREQDIRKGHRVVPLASIESKVKCPAYDLSIPSGCWNLDKDPS